MNTPKLWENHCIMCKCPSRFVPRPQTGCGRRLVIKLHQGDVQVTITLNMIEFKHDWTLQVEGSESAALPRKWVVEWSLAKIHIEFERGSKLPGTSSEALRMANRKAYAQSNYLAFNFDHWSYSFLSSLIAVQRKNSKTNKQTKKENEKEKNKCIT